MLFVTNCEVNKNLSLYSNSSHIECAAKTSAGLFNHGDTQRHPDGTPAASSGTPAAPQRHPGGTPAAPSDTPATSPERPGHHSSTSFYSSVKSPSMHHRSLYLSF